MRVLDAEGLGRLVRARRIELGMSQTELSAKIGSTRQWLSRFEQASNDVSLAHALAVLSALNLELHVPLSSEKSLATDRDRRSQPPTSATGTVPAPSPETKTNRFARLRERDALESVSGSSVMTSQIPVISPTGAVASAGTSTPGDHRAAETTDTRGGNRGRPQDLWDRSTLPRRVSTKPGLRSQWKPGHSVDEEIARIRKSGLFQQDR